MVDRFDTGGFAVRAAPAPYPDALPGPEQIGSQVSVQNKDLSGCGPWHVRARPRFPLKLRRLSTGIGVSGCDTPKFRKFH
ncbi:hypothetical protein [Saccharopolyspora hattusasensis]|uniref:hypothetical protein n=1 Tax=Saccharopolyspora hattusasensis TaxID=1128679 RepID=UPI003D990F1B